MKDVLKNRVIGVLAVFSAAFFLGALGSCNSSIRNKAARDKEMAARLALEERSSKFIQERIALEEKAKAKESEAAQLRLELEKVQNELAQNASNHNSLKEELEKVTKLKDSLELQLKQALADGKKPKR